MKRDFLDEPPLTERVNSYDEQHLATYIRLLDADAEGADWREAVRIIFELDPAKEPVRAKLMYESYLTRARWMTEYGYQQLRNSKSD